MSDDDKIERSWQQIVEEASRERDPEKIKLLSEELERVLDKRAKKLKVLTEQSKTQRQSA